MKQKFVEFGINTLKESHVFVISRHSRDDCLKGCDRLGSLF